jgi:hypothetical protein
MRGGRGVWGARGQVGPGGKGHAFSAYSMCSRGAQLGVQPSPLQPAWGRGCGVAAIKLALVCAMPARVSRHSATRPRPALQPPGALLADKTVELALSLPRMDLHPLCVCWILIQNARCFAR